MITPATFLDELERAFPELGEEVARARAAYDPASSAVDVYGWVGLLRRRLEQALVDHDASMLTRCFDFLELLFREAHAHVLTAVTARILEASPELAGASAEYGGPYTQMAPKFDAEGIAPD